MKTIKKLTPQEWNSYQRTDKASQALKIPWELFGTPRLIDDYVTTTHDLTVFKNLKAFIVLQHLLLFKTCEIEKEELMDSYVFDLSQFTTFKLNRRVVETQLKVSIQYQYVKDVERDGFLFLSYADYDKAKGKVGMLVDAIMYTYNKVPSLEILWWMVLSKFGAGVYNKSNVDRYVKEHYPNLIAVEEVKEENQNHIGVEEEEPDLEYWEAWWEKQEIWEEENTKEWQELKNSSCLVG